MEQALELMDHETWLNAQRAVELGLVDEVMFENNNKPNLTNFKKFTII